MPTETTLCLVIPVYNEEKHIAANMAKLAAYLDDQGVAFSLVLVDDGSRDGTWLSLKSIAAKDSRVSCLRLSRNFGKEAAICAGLRHAKGDYFLVMDSDLQHPPEYIPEMLALAAAGDVDIVDGVKRSRGKESFIYKHCASLFYTMLRWLSGVELSNSSDFKLLSKNVVEELNRFTESRLFFRGIVEWVGFRRKTIYFDVQESTRSQSTFNLYKRIKFSLDAVLSYTSKPLYFPVVLFAVFMLFAMGIGTNALVTYARGVAVSGFTTVILLILIVGALLCFILTIMGMYISRIYDEVKFRPQFIVSEVAGDIDLHAAAQTIFGAGAHMAAAGVLRRAGHEAASSAQPDAAISADSAGASPASKAGSKAAPKTLRSAAPKAKKAENGTEQESGRGAGRHGKK